MFDRRLEQGHPHSEQGRDQDDRRTGVVGKRTLAELWPSAAGHAASSVAAQAAPSVGAHAEVAARADEEDGSAAGAAVEAPAADAGGGEVADDSDGDDGGDGGDSPEGADEPAGEAEGPEVPTRREAAAAGGAAGAGPAASGPAGAGRAAAPGGAAPGPAPTTPAPAPVPLAATLTVPTTTLELLDVLQLSLAAAAAGATYKFEIKRARGARWNTLQQGASSTFSGLARIAGRFKVRGTVTAGGAPQVSAEQAIEVRFPSYRKIVANAAVQTATRAAWRNTLAATTPTTRREEGFWIRVNTAGTGSYVMSATGTGPVVGPAAGATINLPPKPADTPAAPALSGSATYTIASFHTHTPTTYRTVSRVVGPSGVDRGADRTDNVAGVVYDYVATVGGSVPAGHPLNGRARRYMSRSRRSTPA